MFWALIHLMMGSRTYTLWPMLALMLVSVVFLITDSYYCDPRTAPHALVFCSLGAQLTAPSILPILWIYLKKVRREEEVKAVQMSWLVIPVMLFTAALLLILLGGPREIETFLQDFHSKRFSGMEFNDDRLGFYYFLVVVFAMRIAVLVEIVTMVATLLRLRREEAFRAETMREFLRHGGSISVLQLQYYVVLGLLPVILAKTLLFRWMVIGNSWISIVLAVLLVVHISLLGFIGLFAARKRVTRQMIRSGFRFNYSSADKGKVLDEMLFDMVEEAQEDTLARLYTRIGADLPVLPEPETAPGEAEGAAPPPGGFISSLARAEDGSLMGRFEHLMFDEQLFLKPGLTLVEVADRLHSNKTYISRLVNNTYNIPFPDLLNTLRIDYAEQYIIKHRGAKQLETAQACGFPSASSFNSSFKKVTGMTPKIWLATYESQQQELQAAQAAQAAQEETPTT